MKTVTLLVLTFTLTLTTAARAAALPPVDHMVYLSFLPEPAELMQDAASNGLTVLRLDRTSDRVVVSYKYPDGHTATLGYSLLSSARNESDGSLKKARAEGRTYTVESDEPEVVYVERPYRTRYVYRDRYDDFWLPLTLGVGLGWATNWHGGYHGGGYGHGCFHGHH